MEKLSKYTNTAHIAKTNEIVEEVNKLQKDGGKINTVKVNNSPLPITPEDKSVNIDLSGYSPLYHSHRADQVVGLEEKFATKTHSHITADIQDLDTALAGKAPIKHSHEIADINRLNDELSKKAAASHSHAATEVTGLANVAKTGNYSDLKNAPTSLSSFTNDTNYITKNSNITGNAATATKATQDSLGNTIKDTYAKKENIYLYVGKNPIVSELNENTLVIDPDEVNNGTAKPIIDAYTKAESDQKYVVNITGSGGTINVIKGDGSSTPLNVAPPLASQEEATAGTDNTKVMTPLRTKQAIEAFDNTPVGDVVFRPYLKKGYVKANGATVNRADYPRLVKFATDNNLWTDSPSTEPWKYGRGNGSTTMVLPNYVGRFIQGGDNSKILAAGLPNIEGIFAFFCSSKDDMWLTPSIAKGAFSRHGSPGGTPATWHATASTGDIYTSIKFSAQQSNTLYGNSATVQPPAISLIPQIRY